MAARDDKRATAALHTASMKPESQRMHLDDGDDEAEDRSSSGATTSQDGEPHEGKEERLKVVVRVRPLQEKEEPWSAGEKEGIVGDEQDTRVTQRRRPTGSAAAVVEATPTAPVASTLRMHENSITWEKNGQTKMLLADAVFNGTAEQEEVFHSVQDCVEGLLAGFDCSVFAYGQTGTGKTHTMSGLPPNGEDFDDDNDTSADLNGSHGVVPRCIHKLFDLIDQERDNDVPGVSFAVYCSFVEIYNEKIYDILSSDLVAATSVSSSKRPSHLQDRSDPRAGWNRPQPAKEAPSLQMRQKLDGSVFVDGLTSRKVSSRGEMLRAFREGSLNREVRDNLYNQHSSRGHSIFQVTLRKNMAETATADESSSKSPRREPASGTTAATRAAHSAKSRLSRLFFVDLAGSEKWHVNGSDLTDKYAAELSSINKSLSALTSCVLALTQKERTHVPYRDSVLTRLLQSCLQGQGRTAFIVTISPSRESLEESFATLRFAERLKALRCRPLRRKVFANELMGGEQRVYYEKQIDSMRAEVNRLRELLKKAQRRNQEIADSSATAANMALVEENRRLKELLMHSERNRLVGRVSVGKNVRVEQAPPSQRLVAKQILHASTRPVSEEDAVGNKAIGDSVEALPSTPQPLRPRQRHQSSEGNDSSTNEEKQYSTLVNRLQDKEAHLNWMLEAEMEAQNTQSQSESRGERSSDGDNGVKTVSVAPASTSRSWAVERALRRKLVAVPTPVRGTANGGGSAASGSSQSAPRATNEASSTASVIRQRYVTSDSELSMASAKIDSPRRPVRFSEANSMASQAQQPTQRAPTTKPVPVTTGDDAQVKSSSILKLVGSSTAERMGKSKNELVDEYKRARRAELEAMLRTMVQR